MADEKSTSQDTATKQPTKLYCATDIVHGYVRTESNGNAVTDRDGRAVTDTVRLSYGDEFKADNFTKEEIAGLIEAGALTRVNPLPDKTDEVTLDDIEDIVGTMDPAFVTGATVSATSDTPKDEMPPGKTVPPEKDK
ncbi:MAG: hypothetical protein ABL876_00165 [Chitinophagaceae bacterium]